MFAVRKIHRPSAKLGVSAPVKPLKILEKRFVMIRKEETQLR
jgi:hypothetical protein